MAFLTIYTPTYQRPTLLQQCIDSVQAQTAAADIQHVIVHDDVGVGVAGMFAAIPVNVASMSINGRYVYILQDDDCLVDSLAVAELQAFAQREQYPEVIICKNKKRGNVYPTEHSWQKAPREGHIDLGSYVVRQDVFRRFANRFGERYAGDIDFIESVWREGYSFAWWPRLFAREQLANVPGLGRAERELVKT